MPILLPGETYPDISQNLFLALEKVAAQYPEKTAITSDDVPYKYKDIIELVERLMTSLRIDYGIRKGDVVLLYENANIEFVIITFAILGLGGIVCPLNTKLTLAEINRYIETVHNKLFIIQDSLVQKLVVKSDSEIAFPFITDIKVLNEILADGNIIATVPRFSFYQEKIDPNDGCFLLFTSGTSNKPKIVQLSHRNVLHAAESYRRAYKLTEHDSSIISVPIFYVTGLIGLLTTFLLIGGSLHLFQRFDAQQTLSCVSKNQLTFLHISPTVLTKLLDQEKNYQQLPSLRIIACGSSYLPNGTVYKFKGWLSSCSLQPVFGMTETSSPALIMPIDVLTNNKLGSVGLPIAGLEVKIVDVNGTLVSQPTQEGNLYIRGTNVINSYYLSENSNDFFDGGWLNTGDIAYVDDQGFYYICGRAKDLIIRGGENILPSEIEDIISELNWVKECSVFGVTDQFYGEIVHAAIVMKEGFDLVGTVDNCIHDYLSTRLASYKIPTAIMILCDLPRSGSGKVSKMKLRHLVERGINYES